MKWRRRQAPVVASPPRVVYGDEVLRGQVATAVLIASMSPEPRWLAGGPR